MLSTVARLARERLEALRPRTYRRFVAAVLVTNVGNGMQFIANVWLVLALTNRPSMVPLLLLTTALPGLLLGPVIGVAIDRFDRRLLYVVTDLVSGAVLAVSATLIATGAIRTSELFGTVFLLGLSEQVATPTGTTLVKEIVPVERLLAANATNGVAVQLGNVTGAALGGVFIALFSVTSVLVVNLGSFLLSALLVLGVHAGRRAAHPAEGKGWRSALRQATKGISYLRTHRSLVPTYLMLLLMFATLYMLNSLLPPFARNVIRVGPAGLGYIDAMFAVGAVLGGIVLPLLAARLNRDRVAACAVAALGVLLVGMGRAHGLLVPMMLYATIGLTYQSFYVFRTRVQEKVPLDLQGRVFSLLITGVGLSRMVVYGLLGIFASNGTLRLTYAAWGVVLVLVAGALAVPAFSKEGASARYPATAPRRAVPSPSDLPQAPASEMEGT